MTGNLEYEADSGAIVYEEKDLGNAEHLEVTLNKLRRTRHNNKSNSYSTRPKDNERIYNHNKAPLWNNQRTSLCRGNIRYNRKTSSSCQSLQYR